MLQTRALPGPPAPPALFDPSESPEHLKDASHFAGRAEAIYFPESEEEIAWILRRARKEKRPVTLSGGGTGLTGGRVPQGGILLCTDRLNRILRVQWDEARREGSALVQAGVSLRHLEEALDLKGLFYPPDPGEKAAFLGGTVATNASGPRSLKYGATRRHIRGLKLVLANGELLEIARGQEKAREGRFEIRFSDGATATVPVPAHLAPAGVKNAAGYFSEPGMDAVDLFVGSEGTLGVVTAIEVTVLKKPPAVVSGILFFVEEKACFSFAMEARRRFDPRALEFMDAGSLSLLRGKHPRITSNARAALYFEKECRRGEEAAALEEWPRRAQPFGGLPGPWLSSSPREQAVLRGVRYDLPVLANELAALSGLGKLATDFAVPQAQGEAMFHHYLSELPKAGIPYAIWGHLGDNHLHVNFFPATREQFEQARALYAAFAKKAIHLGGTISAEHGIGKVRIPYLEMMVGREGLLQMARVKKALDPEGMLNPGNIFPAELLKEVS